MKPLVEPKQVVSEQSATRVLERGRDLAKLAVPRVIRAETGHQKVTVTIDVDFDRVGCCGCVAVDGEAWSGEAAWRVVDAGNGLHTVAVDGFTFTQRGTLANLIHTLITLHIVTF